MSGVKPTASKICRTGASKGRCSAGTKTYVSFPRALLVTVFTKTGVEPGLRRVPRGRSRRCRSTGPGGRTRRGEGVHQGERIEVCGEIGIRVVLIRHICRGVGRRLRGTVRRHEERDRQVRESRKDAAIPDIRRRDHHESSPGFRVSLAVARRRLGHKFASYVLGDERSFRIADDEKELSCE